MTIITQQIKLEGHTVLTWSGIEQEPSPTSTRLCKLTQVDGRGVGAPCTTKSEVYGSSWVVNMIYRHREVKGWFKVSMDACECAGPGSNGSVQRGVQRPASAVLILVLRPAR